MKTDARSAERSAVAIHPLSRRRFVRVFYWIAVSSPFMSHESLFLAELHAQSANTGTFKMDLNNFPVLRNIYGSVRLRVTGTPTSFPLIVVTRVPNDIFYAVTSRCTHQGCTVPTYSTVVNAIQCPCHGSRFGADGALLRGPAFLPLTRYPTQYDGRDSLRIEIPGLGFRITGAAVRVGTNNTPRYRLSFPTVATVQYEVWFRQSLSTGAWTRIPFSATPEGAATSTTLTGNGSPVTVYVDRSTANGFYAVARL
jgi:nitrite reductase/ring-hydroxylating ferredoxin subunit